MTVDIGLSMAKFAETVTVTAEAPLDAVTSSQEVQLIERKNAQVITDNLGAQEMQSQRRQRRCRRHVACHRARRSSTASTCSCAASASATATPRWRARCCRPPSRTRRSCRSTLFPAGLLDSIQVSKSYSPDRSAEFAGGLVQIVPLKLPSRPGRGLLLRPQLLRDGDGQVDSAQPAGWQRLLRVRRRRARAAELVPDQQDRPPRASTRRTSASVPTRSRRSAARSTRSVDADSEDGAPGQNWGAVFGNRFGKLGVVASVTHSYKEQFVERAARVLPHRRGHRARGDQRLRHAVRHAEGAARHRRQPRLPVHAEPSHLGFENFYSHSGRDEGRFFEGPNTENTVYYRNFRLQFIEEGLLSNGADRRALLPHLSNSRIDWRVNYAQANRDEPDLRETLYQTPLAANADGTYRATSPFTLADESQSGFRMFNDLDDETIDVAANWSVFSVDRARGRRSSSSASTTSIARAISSHAASASSRSSSTRPIRRRCSSTSSCRRKSSTRPTNIGTAFRFNEETRPVDAYDGDQNDGRRLRHDRHRARRPAAGSSAGARVERFEQVVNTFDPFGLFERTLHGREQEHRLLPGGELRAGAVSRTTQPARELQRHGQPAGVPGAGGVRVHRRGRQPRRPRQPGSRSRAHPERRRAAGRCSPAAAASSPPACSTSTSTQPIERVVIAGAQPIVTFQNADKARNFGLELEAGPPDRRAMSSSAPTTRSSTRRSRCCPSSAPCRRRSSARSRASRRTCST